MTNIYDARSYIHSSNIALHVVGKQINEGIVGIGNTSPTEALDVVGNVLISKRLTASNAIFDTTIGVGKSTATEALDVVGNVLISKQLTASNAIFDTTIGIGKSTATEALDVVGNVLISKCMTSSNAVFDTTIVIGKSAATEALDVVGNALISKCMTSSNAIFQTTIGIGKSNAIEALDVFGNAIISGRIGIGTTAPRQQLDIIGNAIISSNLGIGITDPFLPFVINSTSAMRLPRGTLNDRLGITVSAENLLGSIRYNITNHSFEGFSKNTSNEFVWGSLASTLDSQYIRNIMNLSANTMITTEYTDADNKVRIFTSENTFPEQRMIVDSTGNVGIGTEFPSERLEIVGNTIVNGRLTASNITIPVYGDLEDALSNINEKIVVSGNDNSLKAPIDSPSFTGTIATPAHIDLDAKLRAIDENVAMCVLLTEYNTSNIETSNLIATKAPIYSPTFTGTVDLPSTTAYNGVNIGTLLGHRAPKNAPTFTGVITIPTHGDLVSKLSTIDTAVSNCTLQSDFTDSNLVINTAISLKANLAGPQTLTGTHTFNGTVNLPSTTNYNSINIGTALGLKADQSTTYTKTETDTALGLTADQSTTYTKTETDTALGLKADQLTT